MRYVSPKIARRRAHAFALLLVLALAFIAPLTPRAQSGRNKKQPTTGPNSPTTRPKRVGTPADPQRRPDPSQERPMPLPGGTVVLEEAPPPAPTPRPSAAPPADTGAGEEVGAEDVVRITSNLVTVPATVVDAQGRAVTDLKLEDFELRVDGQPRVISELSRAEVPVTMALLFDNSQSLSSAREFEKQAAIKFFRSVMRPIDRAAIYSIYTYPVLAQPLTGDVNTLVRTIDRFPKPEDGTTSLFDTVAEAAAYLRPYPGRKVIIIVSDGADTTSNLDFDTTLKRAQAADCQIYSVQVGQFVGSANLYDLAARRRLQTFSEQTGGALYVPQGMPDIETAFSQISADLAQQYILSYYPTDERNDGLFRTISVRVATRPNMRVRARRGYYPRRSNDRSGNTTMPPGYEFAPAQQQGAPARLSQDVARPDGLQQNASRPLAPERSGGVPPRTRRVGPSEAADEPAVSGSILAVSVVKEEPVRETASRGDEPAAKASEPTAKASEPAAVAAGPAPGRAIEQPPTPKPVPAPPPATASSTSTSRPVADSKPSASGGGTPAPSAPQPSKGPAQPASSAAQPASKGPISGGVLNGKAVRLPMPQYPPSARSMRAQGVVTVEVLVDEEGKVVSARAIDGSQFLRQAAVAAARLARFSPTILSGSPVRVTGVITYKFTLAQ